MYPVSEMFLQAVQENTRKFYWTGRIVTKAGAVHELGNEDIVKGSGYISSQCWGSAEIEIGTVYAAEMGITLFSAIDRYTLEDAKVELFYHLRVGNGSFEEVPMGIFEVSEANRTLHCLEMLMRFWLCAAKPVMWNLLIPRQRLRGCQTDLRCFRYIRRMTLRHTGMYFFNAISMIGEKEDGISLINEILPMTKTEYVAQKITLGFIGGVISTILTAVICMRVSVSKILPLLLLIFLSAFVAALVGLFVGRLSSGLMVGIVYIKAVMILFLAPSILFYLTVPSGSILHTLSYLLPSSATFYGLMDLSNGQTQGIKTSIIVLLAHCILWLLLFFVVEHSKRKKVFAK